MPFCCNIITAASISFTAKARCRNPAASGLDALAGGLELLDELLGVEVRVLGENMAQKLALLVREALGLRAAGEVFAELAFRRLGNAHSR